MIIMFLWAACQWEIYLRNIILWDNKINDQLIFELADEYHNIFNIINNIYLKGILRFIKIEVLLKLRLE